MSIMLAVSDDVETQLLKFIGGLFPYLQQEFELLEVTTLDKAFQYALAVERRVQTRQASNSPQAPPQSTFQSSSSHQSNSHYRPK